MKHLILLLTVLFLTTSTMATAQSYTRSGDTFVTTKTTSGASATKTKFNWQDSKGKSYPIYVGKTGSCYVLKVSGKTNKEYKYYLGAEISQQVCKELGIEYKPRSK